MRQIKKCLFIVIFLFFGCFLNGFLPVEAAESFSLTEQDNSLLLWVNDPSAVGHEEGRFTFRLGFCCVGDVVLSSDTLRADASVTIPAFLPALLDKAECSLTLVCTGDVNGDAALNVKDYLLLRNMLLGVYPENNAAQIGGKMTARSYLLLRQYLVGALTAFPVPEDALLISTSHKMDGDGNCAVYSEASEANENVCHYDEIGSIQPTCSTAGEIIYHCSRCDTLFTVFLSATGNHIWIDADCTHPEHCATCQLTRGEAVGHAYQISNTKAPTCTAGGETISVCSVCGDKKTILSPALGHSAGEIILSAKPGEKISGLAEIHCTRCSSLLSVITIPSFTAEAQKAKSTYSYEELSSALRSLADYSPFAELSVIGKSVQGRNLYVLRLGNPDAKTHVLIQAGMHAKEYMNTALLVNLARYALDYPYLPCGSDGETYGSLLQNICFHLIPSSNPDGAAISQNSTAPEQFLKDILRAGGVTSNFSYYAKMWKSNANGVDLNRNYDIGWQGYHSLSVPFYYDYKGSSPMSEPETKALSAYLLGRHFDAAISLHSWGNYVYYQYGYSASADARSTVLANRLHRQNNFALRAYVPSPAGFSDWANAHGIPAMTVETGSVPSPLPASEYLSVWLSMKDFFAIFVP